MKTQTTDNQTIGHSDKHWLVRRALETDACGNWADLERSIDYMFIGAIDELESRKSAKVADFRALICAYRDAGNIVRGRMIVARFNSSVGRAA
jgi:hypothetical protein